MKKTLYVLYAIVITFFISSFLTTNLYVAAQNNSQGIQSGEQQGIPGSQANANPLTQAPISGLKVKPPNNSTNVPAIGKGILTGTS